MWLSNDLYRSPLWQSSGYDRGALCLYTKSCAEGTSVLVVALIYVYSACLQNSVKLVALLFFVNVVGSVGVFT